MKLFVSPHNDDETLFGAFTILREQPFVMFVYDGHVQRARGFPVTAMERRNESVKALEILGVDLKKIFFCALEDSKSYSPKEISARILEGCSICDLVPDEVYLPAYEPEGHPHHNLVSKIPAGKVKITHYMTYTAKGKSVSGKPVAIENSVWIAKKLQALACYTSQFNLDPRMGCWPHFLRDQTEYYA